MPEPAGISVKSTFSKFLYYYSGVFADKHDHVRRLGESVGKTSVYAFFCFAEFGYPLRDNDLPARKGFQRLRRGQRPFDIGVISVVDNRDLALPFHLEPVGNGSDKLEPRGYVF